MLVKVRGLIGNQKIYVMIDETIDTFGKTVCNILIGALNGHPFKPVVIATLYSDKTDAKAIYEALLKGLDKLYDKVKPRPSKFLKID